MTVALFCGSREWSDPGPVRAEIARLEGGDIVVHGDQRGADLTADTEARRAGLSVISRPASWDLGPSAGPIRNEEMLKLLVTAARQMKQPVRVVAFHEDPQLGRGTRDMVRRAAKAGIKNIRVFVSSELELLRANGDVECSACGAPYWKHPDLISSPDQDGNPFLKLGCCGTAWKL